MSGNEELAPQVIKELTVQLLQVTAERDYLAGIIAEITPRLEGLGETLTKMRSDS